jgi:hypothetical protein
LAHQIANLRGGDTGNTVYERTNFGKAEVQLRRRDARLGGLDRRLTGLNERFVLTAVSN